MTILKHITALALIGAAITWPRVSLATDLDTKTEAWQQEHELPGMVTLIVDNEQEVFAHAAGAASMEENRPITMDSQFRLYFMTKPITSAAVMLLVEDGAISLDDDIRQHLPAFKPFRVVGDHQGTPHTVTVRQLLTHTAGFGYGGGCRSWAGLRYLIANPLSRNNTLQEMVDDLSGIDLFFPPGSRWGYSIAHDILAALVENVSGITYDEFLQQRLFKPLGMSDTDFWVPATKAKKLVSMYNWEDSKPTLTEQWNDSDYLQKPQLMSGGGGLVSSARDYARFLQMLLNDGVYKQRQILSAASVELLTSNQLTESHGQLPSQLWPNSGFGFGLGVKLKQNADPRSVGSFYWAGLGGTIFWVDKKERLVVVGMMQVEDGFRKVDDFLAPSVYAWLAQRKDSRLSGAIP